MQLKLLGLVASGIVLGVALYAAGTVTARDSRPAPDVFTGTQEVLQVRYFYEPQFQNNVQTARKNDSLPFPGDVYGGIIPHDISQGNLIAHFFQSIAAQKPQTVILLGPNHHDAGDGSLITTSARWHTKYGIVQPQQVIISGLVASGAVRENSSVMEKEHALSSILPYIAYYLPDTRVVPLIFKSTTSRQEISRIAQLLLKYKNENTIAVAAVDFSHYLTVDQAAYNDRQTEAMLKTLDVEGITSFGSRFSDYLDSPAATAVLFWWLDSFSGVTADIVAHTNSGLQNPSTTQSTTGYFEVIYYAQ